MHVEAISPVEQEKSSPPTTLHLFRYKGSERANLQERVSAALQLEKNCSRTQLSLDKLHAAKNARLNRLSQTAAELLEQSENFDSSISCGHTYIKMRDELPNLSPKDFMEFFSVCLKFNTLLNQQSTDSINTQGKQAALLNSISKIHARRIDPELEKIVDTAINNPPEWFENNRKAWELFVMLHVNFTLYLEPDLLKPIVARRLPVKEMLEEPEENCTGFTKQGEFPDWLLEENGVLPTREEVEEELAEDNEQKRKTIQALQKIKEQRGYLIDTSTEKTKKALGRLLDLVKETFPNIVNFADMILFLEIVHKSPLFTMELEKMIADYTRSQDILKISEPIALYIERKLRQGKIIENSQSPIDTAFINLFASAINHIKTEKQEGSAKTRFQIQENKKASDTLNFRLRPFLEMLSQDELSFLQELLSTSKDMPIELFILDLASTISSRFNNMDITQLSQSQHVELNDLKKFTASFLRNHATWAFSQIQQALAGGESKTELATEQVDLEPLQQDIDATIEEITRGNLRGWQIFYTDNKTVDPDHLSKIEGESLEEREEALQKYLHYNNISSSIKTGSIIRALEWITGIPQDLVQVKMTKEIAGEVFKKVKRGNLRIFYILDAAQKKIIFFTHQKKSWNYGF